LRETGSESKEKEKHEKIEEFARRIFEPFQKSDILADDTFRR